VDAAVSAACDDHRSALPEELRCYVNGALDLLEPLIEQVRTAEPAEGAPQPEACAHCPVCAVITVLRGGRSDLAVRLAEQATGLIAVLRAALAEGVGGFAPGAAGGADERRDVQRITVTRDGAAPSAPR
jgi:hypothetical protein